MITPPAWASTNVAKEVCILDCRFSIGKKQVHVKTWIRSSSFRFDNRKSKIQNRKLAGSVALVATLAMCGAMAQAQPKQLPRIGYLVANFPSTNPGRVEAFRQGLRDFGYVEGKSIVIEWRYAEGKADRLPALATELVRLKVDVIVTAGPASTRPAKEATVTVPIVMGFDNDPVGNGFVASLARPGGNITGLSTHYPEITGKQLELLKEIVPRLLRVAVLRA